jgi:hypothetical protein
MHGCVHDKQVNCWLCREAQSITEESCVQNTVYARALEICLDLGEGLFAGQMFL